VLFLAKPYLAGQSKEKALLLARSLYEQEHFSVTLDILGEDAQNDDDCDASLEHYKSLIKLLAQQPFTTQEKRQQPTVSFKPSMFSTKAPQGNLIFSKELDKAYNRIESLVDYAGQHQVNVTLEAEDHRWTDFQLAAYFSLIEGGYKNLGTVLQTRLFRTAKDLERFDHRMRTRLVIGIYNEPAQIAHAQKPQMKNLLLEYSKKLLAQGTYVEMATHDTQCLERFLKEVVIPNNIASEQFETQYLHGVPRKQFQRNLVSGAKMDELKTKLPVAFQQSREKSEILVRMYLPFGEGPVAGAYCRRRLKENPNMAIYGLKNLLGLNK
jgi:proline dehydrogenase